MEKNTKPSALEDGFLKCVALSLQQREANIGHRTKISGAKRNHAALESNEDQLFLGQNNNHGSHEYEDDDMSMGYADSGDEGNEAPEIDPTNSQIDEIDESMRADFKSYCKKAANFVELQQHVKDALNLMRLLRQTKASLDTYDSVMEWHLKSTGKMHPHESLGQHANFRTRQSLFKDLRERYNMSENYNNNSKIILPCSRARVNIVWTDAKKAIQSLLTDPRIRANDYIFEGNDPFAPPTESNVIGDLHTGRAYIKTYDELIERPNEQILLPVIFYIDGAATGQFSDHEITAVKISLGIFTRKARDNPHFWRTIGYIPPNSRDKSRGKRLLIESGHLDATRAIHEAHEDEGHFGGSQVAKSQDFHAMLDKVLESFVKIQGKGFKWDLFYNETLYKDVEFVPFVPFIKCDTDEGDKLCGSYTSRGRHVKQLCRYCKCPTLKCDDHLAQYPMKTKAQIQGLVDRKDLQELKNLSQQCIQNACYKLRFGLHNNQSVHGATPLEMLHALLLGIFKYLRDTFFEQLGESSDLSKQFDALAKEFGSLLSRQSSREKPKTKFSNGIRKGKLMAKEYTGVLWVMLVVIQSAQGTKLLSKKKSFGPTFIADWVLLIETLLQWEEWMKSPIMRKKHVYAARQKHRYIMYLVRKVAQRQKGMGLKLTKFHAILHIADDILNFGVPLEVDTGSNESGHKPTKTAAKLTQKQRETFEIQTANRLDEVFLLDLADLEFSGKPLWHYYVGHDFPNQEDPIEDSSSTGGAKYRVTRDQNGEYQIHSARKINGKVQQFMVEETFVSFLGGLQHAVAEHYDEVLLQSMHQRNGQIFRSDTVYRGTVWRDWVYVDWGNWGILPNKIWGFVDLTDLPLNSGVEYGGLSNIPPGVYAIVENANWTSVLEGHNDVDGKDDSELVRRIQTDVVKMGGKVHDLVFYLADVEAFHQAAIVVPDIGGPENGYLVLKNRPEWREYFELWLDSPHADDEMSVIFDSDESDLDDSSTDSSNRSSDEEDKLDL